MNFRNWIWIGAVMAGLAVGLGAIGTHVLDEVLHLSPEDLETFSTGVTYQMYHALGLIAIGLVGLQFPSRVLSIAAWLFLAGILLFSGGIYAWLGTGIKPFVHVVPIGGTGWIIGWFVFAVGVATARGGVEISKSHEQD